MSIIRAWRHSDLDSLVTSIKSKAVSPTMPDFFPHSYT